MRCVVWRSSWRWACDKMLKTKWPLADHSVDHQVPRGTKNDNSVCPRFTEKLFDIYGKRLRVLDLGCSGGGFVKSVLDGGGFAIGVDGSDYSKKNQRAEWATIPDNLFTADITMPFAINTDVFSVVTAWEVLEHLSKDQLVGFETNIWLQTEPGSLFIGSVNSYSDFFEGHEYHQTIEPFEWWHAWFTGRGWKWRPDMVAFFHPDWVRGPHTDGGYTTNFVFERA